MVHYQIDEDAHAALLATVGKFDEIGQGAVARIYTAIIDNVVAAIAQRRGLERHKPERGDTDALQIIEAAHQALEVSNAVAICIHISGNRQAVDDRVLIPEIVDHASI